MADGGGSIVWRFGIGGAEEGKRSLRDLGQAGVDAFQATGEAAANASRKVADQSPAIQRLAQSYQALERARQAQQGFNSLTAPGLVNTPKSAEESAAAFEALGNKAGLTSMQVQELTAVVRHSVDAIASGASPLTVISQHAATTAQALGSGPGGVAGSLKTLWAVAGDWAPLAVGAAGLAALTVAAVSYAKAQQGVNTAVETYGGATSAQLNAYAEAASKAGKVSIQQALEIEEAALRTGAVGDQVFPKLINLTRDYAAVMGIDAKNANAALATSIADPVRMLEALQDKTHRVSDEAIENTKRLMAQGEVVKAQTTALDALAQAFGGAADHAGAFSRNVRAISQAASDAANNLGGLVVQALKVAALEGRLGRLKDDTPAPANGTNTGPRNKAAALVRADSPDDQRYQGYADELQLLRNNRTAGDADSIAKRQYALSTRISDDDRARRLAQNSVAEASARTPAQKAAAAEERVRIENLGKLTTAEQVNALAVDAGAKARETAAKAGDRHAASLAREGLSLEVNAAGARAAAAAYLKSTAAGEHADAVRKAATEATKKGESPEKRAARQSDLDDAESARDEGKAVAALKEQTAARRELDAAVSAGSITQAEAQRRLQDEATLRPYVAKLQNAQRQGETANIAIATAALKDHRAALAADHAEADAAAAGLRRIASQQSIEDIAYQARLSALAPGDASRAGIVRSHAETVARRANQPDAREAGQRAVDEDAARLAGDRTKFLSDATQQLDKQHDLSVAELATAAQSAGQRALELADLKARQDFKDRGLQADDQELAGYRERVRDQELLNQQLERANAYWSGLRGLQDGLGDAVGKMAEDMGDVNAQAGDLLSIAKSIYAEWIKLALVNPLKNDLFGQNNPTISGGFGGLADLAKALLGGSGTIDPTPRSVLSPSVSLVQGFATDLVKRSVPGFATGTDDSPEGWAWVGENGPELRYLNRGTKIATHQRSMEMASAAATRPVGGSGGVQGGTAPVIHVNDYRKAGAPPVRQRRGADGSTHFDIRDEFTRGVDGYVKSGALERSLRTTPSVATRRGA